MREGRHVRWMFTFKHPKPFIERPVAMQIVARKAQALPDLTVLIVEKPALPEVKRRKT